MQIQIQIEPISWIRIQIQCIWIHNTAAKSTKVIILLLFVVIILFKKIVRVVDPEPHGSAFLLPTGSRCGNVNLFLSIFSYFLHKHVNVFTVNILEDFQHNLAQVEFWTDKEKDAGMQPGLKK